MQTFAPMSPALSLNNEPGCTGSVSENKVDPQDLETPRDMENQQEKENNSDDSTVINAPEFKAPETEEVQEMKEVDMDAMKEVKEVKEVTKSTDSTSIAPSTASQSGPALADMSTTVTEPKAGDKTGPISSSGKVVKGDIRAISICANCKTTETPLWRRGPDDQVLCNACGLYVKARNINRPITLKRSPVKKIVASVQGTCPGDGRCDGTGGSQSCAKCPSLINNNRRNRTINKGGSEKSMVSCQNCGTVNTPLWRRDMQSHIICNACGLYNRMHKGSRPADIQQSEIVRRRKRTRTLAPTSPQPHPQREPPAAHERKCSDEDVLCCAHVRPELLQSPNGVPNGTPNAPSGTLNAPSGLNGSNGLNVPNVPNGPNGPNGPKGYQYPIAWQLPQYGYMPMSIQGPYPSFQPVYPSVHHSGTLEGQPVQIPQGQPHPPGHPGGSQPQGTPQPQQNPGTQLLGPSLISPHIQSSSPTAQSSYASSPHASSPHAQPPHAPSLHSSHIQRVHAHHTHTLPASHEDSPLAVLEYLKDASQDTQKEYIVAAQRQLHDRVSDLQSKLAQAEFQLSECDRALKSLN